MVALGTAAVAMLVWAGAALATAAIVSIAWRWIDARVERLHPRDAAWISLGCAVAPFAVPTLIVLVCLAPGALGLLGLPVDHCLSHPDHPHLCLVHGSITLTPLLAVWLAAFGVATWMYARGAVRSLMAARRGLAFLALAPGSESARDVGLLESRHAFSITAGLLRPRIWLSTALVAALTEEQRAVVEAHERAHVRRRDPLSRWLAGWLSLPILPGVRQSILGRLHLAAEQACDEAAGDAVGDRVLVAETLLAVARLVGRDSPAPAPPVAASFGRSFISERVESLLDPIDGDSSHRSRRWPWGLLLVGVVLVVPLHHGVEHVLAVVGVAH